VFVRVGELCVPRDHSIAESGVDVKVCLLCFATVSLSDVFAASNS